MRRAAGAVAAVAVLACACAAPPDEGDEARLAPRFENALEVVRARLLTAGGPDLLHARALPFPGEAGDAGWTGLAEALVPGVHAGTPLFLGACEDEGTDLFQPNQAGFVTESYLLRLTTLDPPATGVAEIRVGPLPVNLSRGPEP